MLLKNNSNRRKYEFVRNWPRYHFWPCQDAHSGKRWLPLECNDGFFPNVWIWVVEIRSPTPAFPKMWLEFLSMQLLMKFTQGKNVRACRMGLHTNLWQNIFDFIDLRKTSSFGSKHTPPRRAMKANHAKSWPHPGQNRWPWAYWVPQFVQNLLCCDAPKLEVARCCKIVICARSDWTSSWSAMCSSRSCCSCWTTWLSCAGVTLATGDGEGATYTTVGSEGPGWT